MPVGLFHRGKIYKLTCDDESLVYYGSTIQKYISSRLANHKSDYESNRKYKTRSTLLFDVGGVDIQLVEEYPCLSLKELEAREGFYIKNNPCVNCQVPGKTIEEKREEQRIYARNHADKRRAYFIKNKEKIDIYQKKYRADNKEKFNRKILCECGTMVSIYSKTPHLKTNKHFHGILDKMYNLEI